MRTAETLIRLGRCPGWSESSLGPHAILLVLSWVGSNAQFSTQEKDMIGFSIMDLMSSYSQYLTHISLASLSQVEANSADPDQKRQNEAEFLSKLKQVAQRATTAHLSPMCQGQISFQKHINGPWKPEAWNRTRPSFYACPGYQQLWWWFDQKWMSWHGDTIFPL